MCWLFLILYMYFNLIQKGLCFVNYTAHFMWRSCFLNVDNKQYNFNGNKYANAVYNTNSDSYNDKKNKKRKEDKISRLGKLSRLGNLSRLGKLSRSIRSNDEIKTNKAIHDDDDLEELFSKDNDERRLIKEKAAAQRYFSEINNPLLEKISHDNQKKSSSKLKILAKRAKRKSEEYNKEIERIILEQKKKLENKKNKEKDKKLEKEKIKETQENNKKEETKETENKEEKKNYRRSKITEKELGLLPLRVPGIRALDVGLSDKVSVEEFDSLIKLGYDGIVDMNSLFINKENKKEKKEKDKEIINKEETKETEYKEEKEKNKKENERKDENISDSEFVNVSFGSLGIYDKNLIRTLKVKGVKKPTYTQKRYIPEITNMMKGTTGLVDQESENFKSSIIHASTGSGKTLTYMLPIFQSCFDQSVPLFTQGSSYDFESMLMYFRDLVNQDILVVCPSLELCVQSCKVAKDICDQYEFIYSENEENIEDNKKENRNKENKEKDTEYNKKEIKEKNKNEQAKLRVKTEIRPTLLIGNANVVYQKKNIKKINSEKEEDYRVGKEVIDGIKSLRLFAREAVETADTIKRTVGMYFATPGRLHSIFFKHKLLDINNFKYIVMDEYDSYLDDYKKLKGSEREDIKDNNKENKKIKNIQTKELLQNIFNQLENRCGYMELEEIPKEFKQKFIDLGRKYVMCVSASDNIDMMPEGLKKQILKNKNEKEDKNNKEKYKKGNETQKNTKEEKKKQQQVEEYKTNYQFPKNILHTMAIYSVPDAKLSLLRKILKSVPYNKSVLVFCDSNGTANFLFKYLSEIFKDSSIELLNSVQNRISRRKAFSNVIQTNIDNTNLYNNNKKTTRLVKDILISTRLNSRGIDFSGYTHVINYDLPHEPDSYIHKSGRIGRAGNPGICISLVESKNLPVFKRAIVNHLPLQFHTIDSNNGLLVTKS